MTDDYYLDTDAEAEIHAKKGVRKVTSSLDISLIMLVLLLGLFGLVMIYSTSSYNAARYYNDATLYVRRQGIFLAAGTFVMLLASKIDYRIYKLRFGRSRFNLIWLLYFLCLGLQAYVLFNGYAAGGSSRWIQIPGIGNFQPSEITKIGVILLTAYLCSKTGVIGMSNFVCFLLNALPILPLLGLVAFQNLSTAIVIGGIFGVICLCSTQRKGYYFIVLLAAAVFVVIFVTNSDYRMERITSWLSSDNLESGSQILEGLYAIASGGLMGKGLGESIQKLGYIPEVHTDMIFTVICEELGILGAIIVISVYLIMLWRLFKIARNAPDLFGALIAAGVFAHISLQLLLNIAVVTNSIPATGIPLPFISYGGSSLLVLMAEMGLALSVSRYTYAEKIEQN